MLTLGTLHAAAEAHASALAENASAAHDRERRDISDAIETRGSVGDSAWKSRWRAEMKARAAARVRDALAELMEE